MTDQRQNVEGQALLDLMPPPERLRTAGALLFVATDPVPLPSIAHYLGCTVAVARRLMPGLEAALATVGLVLQWTDDDHLQLGTAPDLAGTIRQFLGQERGTRLSQAALETVALISYRQPVTRSEIEAIRGVDSSGVLQTLLARGLIEPVGRLPAVGSPLLYATTPEFLRLFGLTSVRELPELPDELIARIDERAESGEADPEAAS